MKRYFMFSFCPFARLKNVGTRTEIEERDSRYQYLVVISLFDLPMILNTLKYVACEKTPIVILVAKWRYKRVAGDGMFPGTCAAALRTWGSLHVWTCRGQLVQPFLGQTRKVAVKRPGCCTLTVLWSAWPECWGNWVGEEGKRKERVYWLEKGHSLSTAMLGQHSFITSRDVMLNKPHNAATSFFLTLLPKHLESNKDQLLREIFENTLFLVRV